MMADDVKGLRKIKGDGMYIVILTKESQSVRKEDI